MKKRKSTGFALLLSFCSMLLCIVALIGTSFAWFTSTDTVAVNQIRAGTLGIELVDNAGNKLENGLDFYKKDSNGNITTENILWEPGSTFRTKSLFIKNVGDLDVVYKYIVSIPQLSAAAVSDGSEIDAELNQSATLFDSIDFSIVVCDSQVTGDDAEICRFNWNKGSYTMEVSADTLGGENVVWRGGVAPDPLPDLFSLPAQTVASMLSQGINSRYYIYMEGTMQQNASSSIMGSVLSGIQITAYAYQSNGNESAEGDAGNVVTITSSAGASDEYTATLTDDNTTYKFVGNFKNITIITTPGLNQIFDGTEARVSGQVKLGYSDIVDSIDDVVKENQRTGSYTVKGFTAGTVGVAVYNTTVTICDNNTEFLNYDGGNVVLNILNNNIDGKNSGHSIYDTSNSNLFEYGVYVYAVNYNLNFSGNTITNTLSHGFVLNGRVANIANALSAENVSNNIFEVKNNKITIADGKAAFKIWDDTIYAPATVASVDDLTVQTKAFIDLVNGDSTNSFTITNTGTVFNIYDLKIDNYQ